MRNSVDVPFFKLALGDAEVSLVEETIRAGWLGQGQRTRDFEAGFARHENARHAVATNSCTAALHAAVAQLGAGPGDAVLVPTHTWVSTAEAVANQGATPVFVDCDPHTHQFDMADAEQKIELAHSGKLPGAQGEPMPVVGMITVYYAGLIPDEAALRQFADRHLLWWLTDAAHAFTASARNHDGKWVPCGGGIADAYCYSFYPNKPMTTGDGGMVVTNNADLADRVRCFCNHGLSFDTWSGEAKRNWDKRVVTRGYKYTMTDIDASIGLAQLAKADAMRIRRAEIAAAYDNAFAHSNLIDILPQPDGRKSSHHLYPIRLRGHSGRDRDRFIGKLQEIGVDCRVHWRPLHVQPWFESLGWRPEHCGVSTNCWTGLVSLPIYDAMSDGQVNKVIDGVTVTAGELVNAV